MRSIKTPSCPRRACGSAHTQLVGFAVIPAATIYVVECIVCHDCERTFNRRCNDPDDPRLKGIVATGEDRLIADSFE